MPTIRCTLPVALSVAAVLAVGFVVQSVQSDDEPSKSQAAQPAEKEPAEADAPGAVPQARLSTELHAFMRKKLKASEQILEGLVMEDMELIKVGARELNTMSSEEKWRISRDMMYARFSEEFRNVTRELIDATEAGNADRAALKWMDVTMSCLDCHRYVRSHLVAGAPPAEELRR